MLNIRLSRVGKNRQPSFRVVVQEHTAAVKGKFIEALGFYRPAINPKEFKVNVDRIKYWLSVGAQPSDSMAVLLKKEGIEELDRYIAPRNKKKKSKSEEKSAAPSPATAAPVAQRTPKAETKAETTPEPTPKPASEAAPEPVAEPPTEPTPIP